MNARIFSAPWPCQSNMRSWRLTSARAIPEALEESYALIFEAHVAMILELASLDINHES